MAKDKNKRTHSVHVTLASSNHTDAKRSDNDFYATPPSATRKLLELEIFSKNVWEPCCGMGHIARELERKGYDVKKTDIVDYGYDGCLSGEQYNFLKLMNVLETINKMNSINKMKSFVSQETWLISS